MLKGGAQPEFSGHAPYRMPCRRKWKVDSELTRLQNEGILRPVETSQWAAPIVIVRKADEYVAIIR